MKKIYYFLFAILLFSCNDNDTDKPYSEFKETVTAIEDSSAAVLNGTISVPANSTFNADDLTVATFSEEANVINSEFSVNVSKDKHTTIFVTDENDDVVFMGYANPGETNYKIDASSTVVAMLMNFPIITTLTTEAKSQFVEDIKTNESFSELVSIVEVMTANGDSPLSIDHQDLTLKLLDFFESASTNKSMLKSLDPVKIDWAKPGLDVIFTNPGKAYAVNIGVYRNDESIDNLDLEGIDILADSFGEAVSMLYDFVVDGEGPDLKSIKYSMQEDGYYDFKVRNGRKDESSPENNRAKFRNFSKLTVNNIETLISLTPDCSQILYDTLTELYRTDPQCTGNITSVGQMNTCMAERTYNLLQTGLSRLPRCLGLKSGRYLIAVQNYFKYFSIAFSVNKIGNNMILSRQLMQDNAAMDVCYEVINGKAQKCEKVKISGDIDFGEVVAGESSELILTITNEFDKAINYTLNGLNDSFEVFDDDLSGTIEANQEKEIPISFNPQEIQQYEISSSITVDNEDVNDIQFNLTGTGIQKKLDIELVDGNLDFGEVAITSEQVRTIKLTNNNETVPINVESITEPDGFSVDYTDGLFLEAGEEELIRVVFSPSEIKDYSDDLKITSDADPYNHTLSISASGIDTVMELNGDLNFGPQDVNSETTKTFEIINNSSETIQISGIRMEIDPEIVFFVNNSWNSSMPPNSTQEVEVVFIPSEAVSYSGILIVENDFQSIQNSSLPINGEGKQVGVSIVLPEGNDFGSAIVGGEAISKTMTITNNSINTTVVVTDITNTEVFSVSRQNFSILPNTSEDVTIDFTPKEAISYQQVISIQFETLDTIEFALFGQGEEETNSIDMSGEWIPTWQVDQCDILGTYCCGCSFHQNTRNFIFEGEYQCSSNQFCGQLDWQNQQIGSSDTPITNDWTLTGDNLSIDLRSGQASGFQFTDRTLTWVGTYDPDTDTFTGEYTANFYGGLIISAEARGTLTLTRINN